MGSYKTERLSIPKKSEATLPPLARLEADANHGPANSTILQRLRSGQPAPLSTGEILRLQQSIGNQAVLRLLSQHPSTPNTIARQRKKAVNKTGLPDGLKSGVENLSGHSLDDVQVHYNSPEPAQIMAHSYTRGAEIFVGPGREQDLPHEAWHVVQQKQGQVAPDGRIQARGQQVNLDDALEKDADVMGEQAAQMQSISVTGRTLQSKPLTGGPIQGNWRVFVKGLKKSGFFQGIAKGFITEIGKEETRKVFQSQYAEAVKNLEKEALDSIQNTLASPELKKALATIFSLKAGKELASSVLRAMLEPISAKINQRLGRALLWMKNQVPELGLDFEIRTPLPGLMGKLVSVFNTGWVKDLVASVGQATIIEGLKQLITWAENKSLVALKNQAVGTAKKYLDKGTNSMVNGILWTKNYYKKYTESPLKTIKDWVPTGKKPKDFGSKIGEKLAQQGMQWASKNGMYKMASKDMDYAEKALGSVSSKKVDEINQVGEKLKIKGVPLGTVLKITQFLSTWMDFSAAERTSDKIQVLARPAMIALISILGAAALPPTIAAAIPATLLTIGATAAVIMLKKYIDKPLKVVGDYLEEPVEKLGKSIGSMPFIGGLFKNAYIGLTGIGNYMNYGYAKAKHLVTGDKVQFEKDKRHFNRQMKNLTGKKLSKEDMEPTTEDDLLKALDDITLTIDMSGGMDHFVPQSASGENSGKSSPFKGEGLKSNPFLKVSKTSGLFYMKMLELTQQQNPTGISGKSQEEPTVDIENK